MTRASATPARSITRMLRASSFDSTARGASAQSLRLTLRRPPSTWTSYRVMASPPSPLLALMVRPHTFRTRPVATCRVRPHTRAGGPAPEWNRQRTCVLGGQIAVRARECTHTQELCMGGMTTFHLGCPNGESRGGGRRLGGLPAQRAPAATSCPPVANARDRAERIREQRLDVAVPETRDHGAGCSIARCAAPRAGRPAGSRLPRRAS